MAHSLKCPGWWLRIKDRLLVPVHDHSTHVKQHPELFGLSPEQVAQFTPSQHEDELRLLGMRDGWVRIRWHGEGMLTGEYYQRDHTEPLQALAAVGAALGLGAGSNFKVTNLHLRQSACIPGQWFLQGGLEQAALPVPIEPLGPNDVAKIERLEQVLPELRFP